MKNKPQLTNAGSLEWRKGGKENTTLGIRAGAEAGTVPPAASAQNGLGLQESGSSGMLVLQWSSGAGGRQPYPRVPTPQARFPLGPQQGAAAKPGPTPG